MSRDRTGIVAHLLACSLLLGMSGCASLSREKPSLAYDPESFRQELALRLPERLLDPTSVPHEIDPSLAEQARAKVMAAPRGPQRVQALVDFLSAPKPDGLGLVYDWSATGSAAVTIELGRGNCVSLAAVLVGLGRALDWPIYFAEARTRRPETETFEEVVAVSDHMAVLVVAKTVQMIVDFTGRLEDVYTVRPIDDLAAYAHILNNLAAQSVMSHTATTDDRAWQDAVEGFELATRIEPELGRAWNNLGIALSKLDRFDEAREAYRRAVELDSDFGSARRNLTMMETRELGKTTIGQAPIR
jgi:tetratricopeptide (TPR) repeat protein